MSTSVAQVWINGVIVGELSDPDYQRIVRSVKDDWRVRVRYPMEVVIEGSRLLALLVRLLPALLFWGLVALALVLPQELASIAEALAALTPAELVALVPAWGPFVLTFAACCLVTAAVLSGRWFDHEGPIDREIHRRIRTRLALPVLGDMSVVVRSKSGATKTACGSPSPESQTLA